MSAHNLGLLLVALAIIIVFARVAGSAARRAGSVTAFPVPARNVVDRGPARNGTSAARPASSTTACTR